MNTTPMTLTALAARIGGTLPADTDGETNISALASLGDATGAQVAFLANTRYQSQMESTQAAAVIVAADYDGPIAEGVALIRCDDAYFAYREAMVALYGYREHPFVGVAPGAYVDETATLGEGVAIAPGATVSSRACVGPSTVIYPGVFVGPDAAIGADCILYPNAVLYDGTVLGERVTVHANATIGQDGFGYATHGGADGVVRHEKIPTVGIVVLEDDVEIGSGCAIERATMGETIIGAGTKFADLVAIGHGTQMGQHCLMVSQAGIAGSTMVGNYCVFAGQAGVVGHIRISDGVRVGAKAGVTNDLPAGIEVLGQPAIPRAEARRIVLATKKLPELRKTVRQMIKQIAKLEARVEPKDD